MLVRRPMLGAQQGLVEPQPTRPAKRRKRARGETGGLAVKVGFFVSTVM